MSSELRQSPLDALHRSLGAKMVPFAGWVMPVEYGGLVGEHLAVRMAVGLFDVSHMGEILVQGRDALRFIQHTTCNDAARLVDGQAQYSGLLTEQGTFVDDILVHRFAEDTYFLCVNAANTTKDADWLTRQATGFDVNVRDVSAEYAQLAVQGPRAVALVQSLTVEDITSLGYYRFRRDVVVAGVPTLVARTGYTGEDGFELYCAPGDAARLWTALTEAGNPTPCGLGARNTLRLEAKMALYGHDIDDTTTPLEADLGWMCKLSKGDFLGRGALQQQKESGLTRKLVGFEVEDRVPVRDGYPLVADGQELGRVTSGSPSPFLKKNIGLAYLPIDKTAVGTQVFAVVRGREVPCRIVPTPFYARPK
ncbi:MAG: glycine cleavage system aminomethyltransferase GcvT [Chloracidobacterium sp.]|uniref:glycine cleavage system aminomethyltransferase GcvT n=1 Tax=Chloracidobacterium validum TaxID=2821543 RepID=UPI001FE4EF37|nr:glycine cleavage system aminomethyltransferase GcvT [Chloracidobacterium validum]